MSDFAVDSKGVAKVVALSILSPTYGIARAVDLFGIGGPDYSMPKQPKEKRVKQPPTRKYKVKINVPTPMGPVKFKFGMEPAE